jgi:hypothetical protein
MRERKLITYTSTDCVFLAGPQRYLASKARLGFHSSSYGGLDEKVLPGINDDMRRTLREHGVQSWSSKKRWEHEEIEYLASNERGVGPRWSSHRGRRRIPV